MCQGIELSDDDKDLNRSMWRRSHPNDPLNDYRMTWVTVGVSASSFTANMAVKQNAIDYSHEFPLAAEVVHKSFYVDDCLTGTIDSKSAPLSTRRHLVLNGMLLLTSFGSTSPSLPLSIR